MSRVKCTIHVNGGSLWVSRWMSLSSFALLWVIFIVDKKTLEKSETLKSEENEFDSFGHGLKYMCCPIPLQKIQVAVLVLYCILKIYFTCIITRSKIFECGRIQPPSWGRDMRRSPWVSGPHCLRWVAALVGPPPPAVAPSERASAFDVCLVVSLLGWSHVGDFPE